MKLHPQTLNNTPRDQGQQTSDKRLIRDHSMEENRTVGLNFEHEWHIDENIKKMRDSFNRRLGNNTTMQ